MQLLHNLLLLLPAAALVAAHARIKFPIPLSDALNPIDYRYNAPLAADGSEFPCKGLHKKLNGPITTFHAGRKAYFEIQGHDAPPGATGLAAEGNLAAHSGGSCQASLSFDNGTTWKVLHSFIGGCPAGTTKNSNLVFANASQIFPFDFPADIKPGDALFGWSWVAASGNRYEFYMNCAKINLEGSPKGNNTLADYPDTYVGDMTIPGHIQEGECASFADTQLEYPNPGPRVTRKEVAGLEFKKPTGGKCYAPGSKGVDKGKGDGDGAVPSKTGEGRGAEQTGAAGPNIKVEMDITDGTCACTCEVPN